MKIGDPISALDLIKHTLTDSFEFSAHSGGGIWEDYELNAVGINFGVSINEDAILEKFKNENLKKAIFAHTHPLVNDESLHFVRGKPDPRKKIALGLKLLPLGHGPSKGDIDFFWALKQKAKTIGCEVSAVVFSVRGAWHFDIDATPSLPEEKKKGTGDFKDMVDDLVTKELYPSYEMEIQVPKNKTDIAYSPEVKVNPLLKIWVKLVEPLCRQRMFFLARSIEKKYQKHGIALQFIEYKSQGIDPVDLLRKAIEEWESKYFYSNVPK